MFVRFFNRWYFLFERNVFLFLMYFICCVLLLETDKECKETVSPRRGACLISNWFSIFLGKLIKWIWQIFKRKTSWSRQLENGESPTFATKLVTLIEEGIKTSTCGSFASDQQDVSALKVAGCTIIRDGEHKPVRIMRMVRFCDVTTLFARKEGERGRGGEGI